MALPGLKSTADFAANERPQNWREGILLLEPRNGAPLTKLTAAMPSASTDDPTFNWWEEDVDLHVLTVSGAQTNVDTTLEVVVNGSRLKPGDVLKNVRTGEAIRISAVTSDTVVTIQRAVGPGGSAAGTAAAMNDQDSLIYLGSGFREGAPKAAGVSWNPNQKSNVTQIFRDPVEWTRTNIKTRLRTGDQQKEDRRRALNKHTIGIERAFIHGTRYETTENGQPLRFTDGILNQIPSSNVQAVSGGALDMDELESYLARIFQYGSGEKLAFGSIGTMVKLNSLVRKNTAYQWGPNEKEFTLTVRRFHTIAGTLALAEHPLFASGPLVNDLLILDTAELKYRYITDTMLRKDVGNPGDDGTSDEYLTEAGLELHKGKTHFWLQNINTVAKDA